MCVISEQKNIKEFIALILQTEIPEAKLWVVKYVTPFRGWDSYEKMAATEESVAIIAEGIAAQISIHLRRVFGSGDAWSDLSSRGHQFLQEIYYKGVSLGLTLDLRKMDSFWEPRMPPMA